MYKTKTTLIYRWLMPFLICGVFIIPGGCRNVVPEDVISSVIDAYSEVETYSLVEKTSVKREVTGGDRPGTRIYGQNCTGTIDIVSRQCEMEIMQDGFPMQGMQTYIKQYLINEMRYTKADTLDYEDKDHELWVKVSLKDEELNHDDKLWEYSNILGQQIELLNTAQRADLLRVEKYNSVNAYVLDIEPDWESFTDWISGSPPWQHPDRYNFPEQIRHLSFRLWISKETFFIIKSEINTVYNIVSADSSDVTEYFLSEIYFNDYNHPVEIKLPEEALKAIRGPIS
jgi:hypothetical protein